MKLYSRTLVLLSLSAAIAGFTFTLQGARADDAAEVQKIEETEAKEPTAKATWATEVQKKYSLTDDQMKSLDKAGLQGPHLAFAAELAKASGKSIDEVIQMRTGDKMGWGEIAKKLGLPPGSLGQSVAALRHEMKEKRSEGKHEKREEKRAEREERKKAREERKEERKKLREERKEERKELRDANKEARNESRKAH